MLSYHSTHLHFAPSLHIDSPFVQRRLVCASKQQSKQTARRGTDAVKAGPSVLERTGPAPSGQTSDTAAPSTLPASWSERDLDDEQMTRELQARRQRSHQLAETSDSLLADVPEQKKKPKDRAAKTNKAQSTRTGQHRHRRSSQKSKVPQTSGSPTTNPYASPSASASLSPNASASTAPQKRVGRPPTRTKSDRGASQQGQSGSGQRKLNAAAPLNQQQELEVCKAIQRFQAIQTIRRKLLEDTAKRSGYKKVDLADCSDADWAAAAGEPSVQSLGAALNKGRHALAALIQSYTPAIHKFALDYSRKGVEYDEASEAAGSALTHAAALFDTERGGRLSTYVWPAINRRLIKLVDSQSNVVRLPPRSRQRLRLLNETYHALHSVLGRPPSMEEVAAEARMNVRHAVALRRAMQGTSSFEAESMTSQNSNIDGPSTPQEELVADEGKEQAVAEAADSAAPDTFGTEAWHKEFMDRLAMCMDLLADQRAAQAFRLRYGIVDGRQRTLEQVGKALKPKVSPATASELVSRAFEQLRASEWRMRPIQPLLEDMHNQSAQPA